MAIKREDVDRQKVDFSDVTSGQRLPPVHPGEILRDEFLTPLGLSVSQLAQEMKVADSQLNDIVLGRCAITPDIAQRLGGYFGTTPEFWINLQNACKRDFFISYTAANQQWAEWIAWTLEDAGYTTVIQAWDFLAGNNFVLEMQKASVGAERTIAVLSPAYLRSGFAIAEWATAFVQDPTGEQGLLLPVRIEECDLQGLHRPIIYTDLIGRTEEEARAALLAGVSRIRAKPTTPPPFPSSSPEKPCFPGVLPSVWNVPHLRNLTFTGRELLLTQMHNVLAGSQVAALHQPHALRGLGGVGKTQLALEYVYRHAAAYEIVWWIRSEEASTCAADFVALAAELPLPAAAVAEQDLAIAAARRWLEQHDTWLLVFDNAPEPAAVRDYFPRGGGGHIIVTSRYMTWQGTATEFPVEVFDRQESVDYVLATTQQEDQASASALAEALGDLPLALAQAAAYVSAAKVSLSKYVAIFQNKREELWKDEAAPADYGETVATTWAVAMQKLTQEAQAAVAILNLCAFLAPDAIPRSLLTDHTKALPEELATLAANPLLLNRAVIALRRYALLDATADTLTVHRLVQAVTRDRLDEAARAKWTKAALQGVRAAFPSESSSPANWPMYERLVPHALAAANHAAPYDALAVAPAGLLNKTGVYWAARGQLDDAARVLSQALAATQRAVGAEHPDTLASMNNLANVYSEQGHYDQAQPLYEQALAATQRAVGAEHPDTLISMNNLANVYSVQRHYDQARTLHEQALAVRQRVSGAEHPETLASMANLANVYLDQGHYNQAQPLHEQALAARQRVLGAEHPDTLLSMNNLANVYLGQGHYDQAQSLYEQALAARQRVLGAEHPDTLVSMNNLANVYSRQGHYDQAQSLYERAAAGLERVLGPGHPNTQRARSNLEALRLRRGH